MAPYISAAFNLKHVLDIKPVYVINGFKYILHLAFVLTTINLVLSPVLSANKLRTFLVAPRLGNNINRVGVYSKVNLCTAVGGVLQEMCYMLLKNEHLQESVSVVCSSSRFTSLRDHLFFDLIPPPSTDSRQQNK